MDENRVRVHRVADENRYMRHRPFHRVKDSLTSRLSKFICSVTLFVLVVLGIVAFVLWLGLRPHRPRFYVTRFQLAPSFDQPNGFRNATIFYNVTIRNPNPEIEVRYGPVYGAVYYMDRRLGEARIRSEPFEQEPKSSAWAWGSVDVSMQQWVELREGETMGPVRVVFRLEITSDVRFQIYSWGTKRNKIHASCEVAVGPSGFLLDSYRDKRCSEYFS